MASPAAASGLAVPFWRSAGMTYITYSNICARLVRNCLKEPHRSEGKPNKPNGVKENQINEHCVRMELKLERRCGNLHQVFFQHKTPFSLIFKFRLLSDLVLEIFAWSVMIPWCFSHCDCILKFQLLK
ncbi:uncharacterized protein LOC113341032 [Papaver somniferum]|uniref:uncharacterized protein LOC113341032 n=1 Tax=Papaver somniferum TaxID=3469 RepID=UPI000E70437D|nr:uncharacterized protein LOC113341032 [Papaver somniferum]